LVFGISYGIFVQNYLKNTSFYHKMKYSPELTVIDTDFPQKVLLPYDALSRKGQLLRDQFHGQLKDCLPNLQLFPNLWMNTNEITLFFAEGTRTNIESTLRDEISMAYSSKLSNPDAWELALKNVIRNRSITRKTYFHAFLPFPQNSLEIVIPTLLVGPDFNQEKGLDYLIDAVGLQDRKQILR
jgi:hypothetical protein